MNEREKLAVLTIAESELAVDHVCNQSRDSRATCQGHLDRESLKLSGHENECVVAMGVEWRKSRKSSFRKSNARLTY